MVCKNCNKVEGVKYSKYATGDFCSKKCAKSFSTKGDKNETKVIKCHGCGEEIVVHKRTGICYCDDCKSHSEKKEPKIVIKIKKVKLCVICGVEIEKNKKYCNDCITTNNKKKLKENNYNYDYVLNWRNNNKKQAVDFLGGKCVICGYNKCLRNLDFHHVNPLEKEITISHKINKIKFEKLKTELKKCILVCSNCHGEIHDGLIDLSVCLNGLGT